MISSAARRVPRRITDGGFPSLSSSILFDQPFAASAVDFCLDDDAARLAD
jgi:hypothetical protein